MESLLNDIGMATHGSDEAALGALVILFTQAAQDGLDPVDLLHLFLGETVITPLTMAHVLA